MDTSSIDPHLASGADLGVTIKRQNAALQRQRRALDLINDRMEKQGESYDEAFAIILRDYPQLFREESK